MNKLYQTRLLEVLERLPEIITAKRGRVTIYQADARNIPFIKTASVSLIVTSPPYLNAYDYHKYHRQRIHWIDGSVELARDLEIGSHDEFTRPNAKPDNYFFDMDACFSEWARVLKKGGRCLVVIGDAIVSKNPVRVVICLLTSFSTVVCMRKNDGLGRCTPQKERSISEIVESVMSTLCYLRRNN